MEERTKIPRKGRRRTKTQHYTDSNPCTFTSKSKKKRKETEVENEAVVVSGTPKKSRRRKRPTPEKPSPQHHVLSHNIRRAPIFPPSLSKNLGDQYPVVFGRGLGIPQPVSQSQWTPVSQPAFYFPDDLQEDGTLKPDCRSVSRFITCLCISRDQRYLAVGDACGFVSLYTLESSLLAFARLDTSASKREHKDEIQLPPSKKYRKYEKKSHPNAVRALAFCNGHVAVGTNDELELLDASRNSIAWTSAVNAPPIKLDIHIETNEVLFSFGHDQRQSFLSPLWLLRRQPLADGEAATAVDKIEVQPVHEGNRLALGHKCAAMWDRSDPGRLVMVTLIQGEQGIEQELLLLRNQSPSFDIVQRTKVLNKPTGKSNTVEALSQSPQGFYTLVASTRGIRLYKTDTFQLLKVYGDQVALHGHTLVFQDCLFVPRDATNEPPSGATIRDVSRKVPEADWMSKQAVWVLGVPHANREPEELQRSLHVWDLWEGKQAATTILAPGKAGGVRSVVYGGCQLIASTMKHGECHFLRPNIKSEFPGIMYPPGYRTVTENLVYIEDEDEVDVVVTFEEEEIIEEEEQVRSDHESAEATQRSVEEEDEEIFIRDHMPLELPFMCHPERFLKQSLLESSSPSVSVMSQSQGSSFSALLEALPHSVAAQKARTKPVGESERELKQLVKPLRAKRNKAASVEALMKASLDPQLRRFMSSREAWADGRGSSLCESVASFPCAPPPKPQLDPDASEVSKKSANNAPCQLPQDTAVEVRGGTNSVSAEPAEIDCNAMPGPITPQPSLVSVPQSSGDPTPLLGGEGKSATVSIDTNGCERAEAQSSETEQDSTAQPVTVDSPMDLLAVAAVQSSEGRNCVHDIVLVQRQDTPKDGQTEREEQRDSVTTDAHVDALANAAVGCGDNSHASGDIHPQVSASAIDSAGSCQREIVPASDGLAASSAPVPIVSPDGETTETGPEKSVVTTCVPQVSAASSTGSMERLEDQEGTTTEDSQSSNAAKSVKAAPTMNGLEPVLAAVETKPTPGADVLTKSKNVVVENDVSTQPQGSPDPSPVLGAASEGMNIEVTVYSSRSDERIGSSSEDKSSDTKSDDQAGDHRGTTNVVVGGASKTSVGVDEASSGEVCLACRGRWVLHTCGAITLPVDQEAVARAEREKREKEEEEKKRMRAEKRRLADAKRREAKRKKKLEEEERRRREEEERRQQEEERQRNEAEKARLQCQGKDRRRAEMLQRLQNDQLKRDQLEKVPQQQPVRYDDWPLTVPVSSEAEPLHEAERHGPRQFFSPIARQPAPPESDRETSYQRPEQQQSSHLGHAEALASLASGIGSQNGSFVDTNKHQQCEALSPQTTGTPPGAPGHSYWDYRGNAVPLTAPYTPANGWHDHQNHFLDGTSQDGR